MTKFLFIFCLTAFSFCGFANGSVLAAVDSSSSEAPLDEDEMQKTMLDKTKTALFSYEIVEERADYVLDQLKNSAFGDYAKNMAVVVPIVTGKINFQYKKLEFSYSHFAEKAKLDYELTEKVKLYIDHKKGDSGTEGKSGVLYSVKF